MSDGACLSAVRCAHLTSPLARAGAGARAGVDAPTSPSSLSRLYTHTRTHRIASFSDDTDTDTHARRRKHTEHQIAKNPFAGRHHGRPVPSVIIVNVRRGSQRRHGGSGSAVAVPVSRVRGVPVRAAAAAAACWSRVFGLRTGAGTDAAGVRPRVPRALHRQVAASAPRVPTLSPLRAACRRRTAGGHEVCGRILIGSGGGGGACVGATGDHSVRLRRREGGVDAQPVRHQTVIN